MDPSTGDVSLPRQPSSTRAVDDDLWELFGDDAQAPTDEPAERSPDAGPAGDGSGWGGTTQRASLVRVVVDAAVVTLCAAFVFLNLHPAEILSSAVPAGGDMGAHVWGPAYLRDELLPNLRLTGWTPDWYAGFPAYHFYMVVPSLLIVVLDAGLFGGWTMLLPLAAASGLGSAALGRSAHWQRTAGLVAAAALVPLLAELPYGTAFKLVSVLGVVTLPAACYVLGRLSDLPFPGPALLAVASLLFLFDRNFTIYGGNVASTLAGEFAFSISLSIAVVYVGVVVRGLRTGRHRALAALLLALTGLCHLIPAFFALAATALIALMRRPAASTLRWLAGVLPVGGLLSAFWVLPFFWQRAFMNDMGWEKIPHEGETVWKYLVPRTPDSEQDLRWVLALALVGLVLSLAFKVRLGWLLAAFVVVAAVAFMLTPEGRLWNARLLPFYYLSLYLLAAVGVSEVGRTLAVLAGRDPARPSIAGPAVTAVAGMAACMVVVGMPLRTLPFGETRDDGSYAFFGLRSGQDDSSFVRSWARWNYTGYEGKEAYAEYRDVVLTMAELGEEHGCGRAFWEYDKELNRYGTPMALMLLPHWTDGCIGSMEGLFFESSATTPFHFLTQVELSASPSAAQRDLPYDGFDLDDGVRHMQLLGVRYYMATSVQATTAAREHPDLTEIAAAGPWVIFRVADSELVEPLEHEPAVLELDEPGGFGIPGGRELDAQDEWICGETTDDGRCHGPAVAWFTDPERWDVLVAASGPDRWQRVDADDPSPEERPVPTTTVDDVRVAPDQISFTVDEPGTPVLVKASYFPNWQADGADGPYRVAPNLMVVVPTAQQVELTYGRAPIEWVSYLLTLLGIAGVVWLARRPPVAVSDRRKGREPANADVEQEPGEPAGA